MIRTFIIEDDFRVADIHSAYVSKVPGFEVIGKAHTAAAAYEAVLELQPDLVLLDLYLPDHVLECSNISGVFEIVVILFTSDKVGASLVLILDVSILVVVNKLKSKVDAVVLEDSLLLLNSLVKEEELDPDTIS